MTPQPNRSVSILFFGGLLSVLLALNVPAFRQGGSALAGALLIDGIVLLILVIPLLVKRLRR